MSMSKEERKKALASLKVGSKFIIHNVFNSKDGKFIEERFALVDVDVRKMAKNLDKSILREFYRASKKVEHFGASRNVVMNTMLKAENTLNRKIVCTPHLARPGLSPVFTKGYLRGIVQCAIGQALSHLEDNR